MPAIYRVIRTIVTSTEAGPTIYIEVTVMYGCSIQETRKEFKTKARKEIENLTAMNVVALDVVAKNIYVPGQE